jgi:hypothetical protein
MIGHTRSKKLSPRTHGLSLAFTATTSSFQLALALFVVDSSLGVQIHKECHISVKILQDYHLSSKKSIPPGILPIKNRFLHPIASEVHKTHFDTSLREPRTAGVS